MVLLKNIVLGIAIFILTIFVGIYGISTLYGVEPQYDKYCPNINNEAECVEFGGTWNANTQVVVDSRGEAKPVPVQGGYCDVYAKCQPVYEEAQRVYYKKVFLTALPLGVVVIALGALIFGLEAVGSGLMAGGVGLLIYGAGQYWRFADDWLKFVLSLIGLILVIALAYYFNRKWMKKGRK